MKTSQRGLDLIKKWEGLRLNSYRCSAGRWTIGYGATRGIVEGMTVTPEAANTLLRRDVRGAELAIKKLVEVPLSQTEFDALVSFVYNFGSAKFSTSTLLGILNTGDRRGAAREFEKWVYAGGKKLNGLIARRKEERDMFLENEWQNSVPLSADNAEHNTARQGPPASSAVKNAT